MPRALIATHEVFQGTSHNRGYVFAESGPGGVKYKLGLVPFDSTTSVDDVVLAWELPLDIIYMPTPNIITVPSIVPNMDIHTLKTNTVVVAKGARSAMTADALRGFPLNANLLIEAEILWRLQMTSPHPAIIHLYGLKMLRLTQVEGLVLRRYDKTLEQYGRAHLTDDLKRKVKDSITGAINHLRNVQLAHNDITPANIAIQGNNVFLMNFHSCASIGVNLAANGLKTGSPGWGDHQVSNSNNDTDGLNRVVQWMDGR